MIHALGVEHADFEPRDMVRKGWCRLRVIDFAFSNVNHTCPGWGCNELTYPWHKLELDKLTFRQNSGMLRNKFRSVGYDFWYFPRYPAGIHHDIRASHI